MPSQAFVVQEYGLQRDLREVCDRSRAQILDQKTRFCSTIKQNDCCEPTWPLTSVRKDKIASTITIVMVSMVRSTVLPEDGYDWCKHGKEGAVFQQGSYCMIDILPRHCSNWIFIINVLLGRLDPRLGAIHNRGCIHVREKRRDMFGVFLFCLFKQISMPARHRQ